MTGFIALHRSALDHPVIGEAEQFRAWFWLLANACWKPTRVRIKGKIVTLERGQLSFSVRFMAENWGWSKSRVDRFITELRQEGMIETRSKNGTTAGHPAGQGQAVITICNYDKYQDPETRKRDKVEPEVGTTAGQQRDKEEQVNKIYPFPNGKGADDDKAFWANAKSYIGGKNPGALIGKWNRDHGRSETVRAITAAQTEGAVDPVPYIERVLRKSSNDDGWGGEMMSPC